MSAMPEATAAPQSLLAFDYGTRRIGVASGQRLLGRGEPRATVAVAGTAHFDAIARLIAEWQPDALVVGVPFHPDGAEHANTLRARRFARQLQGRFRLPVHEVDERYTTTEALAAGARGAQADAMSAVLIVEQYFRQPVINTGAADAAA
jgi:putative Holliday junction resolvase